ncbi:Alanine--tRNA ligase [Exophiala dermatitidis]|uniref:Alanine--tRNA ligase n=1 Tax=Exophiala dermatitidis TaxID=5970 RepID=A0AAN6IX80_EXODE|nr:Alanine--tRNA ligase [Exophiala dermatitidis]KAJ4532666.1 Alanine--tRNA ligase, variant 2 [Exophiala dermatitidis]KAJ4577064.1 Alanine--tRNA ligase [Exophiala dermatitidis]KAJ4599682.1 Alanine--tRNA ligase [Exophiala dermatitidis]KAJ4605331.1 Alanine--tRNA ligase [Exophiala dermatitidis]
MRGAVCTSWRGRVPVPVPVAVHPQPRPVACAWAVAARFSSTATAPAPAPQLRHQHWHTSFDSSNTTASASTITASVRISTLGLSHDLAIARQKFVPGHPQHHPPSSLGLKKLSATICSSRLALRHLPPTLRTTKVPQHTTARMASTTSGTAQEWTAPKVRETFLKYFEERGHTFVRSSPVVPLSDPTLLFTNAGMNQFKPIFLGTVDPTSKEGQLKRAVNSQKCIRAGGKHNDLDDVGKDSYHHTFFEMLGNWSFGDYFKKEAIGYSWELLTKVFGLDPDRLYVTYFEGNEAGGLEPDLEAKELWKSVGVPEDHILPGNMKDNFWEMGDQGPCGPCSEVHYDRIGGGRNAASLVNQDDPNVLEIWNNVFIQYNREPDKSLRPLPNKHVDTGMGFERLVSVLQDKLSNYDTDVFTPLFDRIQEVTGARPYAGKFGDEDKDGVDTAYRVVADHVRMLTFAISDGGIPNNEGRGYVVRRVLRRGARYARKYLNVEIGNFFSRVVPTLVAQMGDMFKEIVAKEEEVKEILDEEELSFAKTLDRGERQFEVYAQKSQAQGLKKLHGADVWRLYDTFGFPVDLTRLMAEERGLSIDDNEFEEARLKAREASKGEKKAASNLLKLDVHDLGELEKMPGVTKTDDSAKFGRDNINGKIQAIYHAKKFHEDTRNVPEGEQVGLILDKTNFYAEQGGQEYDTGRIVIDGQAELEVENVQVYAGYVLHTGYMKYGHFSTGDVAICEYDELRRWPIRNNHTGTHILNFALREVLGDGIDQKGSLVAPEKLRFDFSHKAPVSDADLAKIEDISTEYIRQNCPVYGKDVPLAIAREITGVRAVFGETYPDPVRVVSVGVEVDDILKNVKDERWRTVSIEFCGGTHVRSTGDIKDLVILEESGIAKGIRRIIAVTGEDAHTVQRVADEFEQKLTKLENMPFGPEKEQEVKATQSELDNLSISALKKSQFRDRFTKISKQVLDHQKKLQKEETKKAIDTITEYFEKNPDAQGAVLKLPVSTNNSKIIPEVIKHVQTKIKDKSVYIFVAGDDKDAEGKVLHGCFVSPVSFVRNCPFLLFSFLLFEGLLRLRLGRDC